MPSKSREVWTGPATPEAKAVIAKHRALLKDRGIRVVEQGHALVTEAGARRWILVTPDGTVTEHMNEKRAVKAAHQWSDAQLEDKTKTVAVLQIDVRRRPKRRAT